MNNNKKKKWYFKIPSIKIIIWSIILLLIISYFYNIYNSKQYQEIDQYTFEQNIIKDKIKSIIIRPTDTKSMQIEGQYKDSTKIPQKYITNVIYTKTLDALLRDNNTGNYKLNLKVMNKNNYLENLLSNIFSIIILMSIAMYIIYRFLGNNSKGIMNFGNNPAKMILPNNEITFNDIAGITEAKEDVMEMIIYLKYPYKYKSIGAKIPKGALLSGPPGSGKTMLAKAVANEAKVPFFSISGSDFTEMFVGIGASRVRKMFKEARKHAPCVIFIDEIDAIGRNRFSGYGGGHDEKEQTLNALLVEMDGLTDQKGVIVFAATNRPDVLDPALTRSGRFDRKIILDLPDMKGRKKILEVHTKKVKLDKSVSLEIIAQSTPGYSGADLANLINEAALLAVKMNKKAISMSEMDESRDKIYWGKERKSKIISNKEKIIIAYHEAGHALTNLHCKYSIPLYKVTIIPRGIALGATMQLNNEDKYLQSENELKDMMTVLMGGRNAEEMTFNSITTGAMGDIDMATKIAKQMVCSFGMNKKLGTISYNNENNNPFLSKKTTDNTSNIISESTAREINEEIKKLITEAKNKSYNILKRFKNHLKILAEELLIKETLSTNEIKELLKSHSIKKTFIKENIKDHINLPKKNNHIKKML